MNTSLPEIPKVGFFRRNSLLLTVFVVGLVAGGFYYWRSRDSAPTRVIGTETIAEVQTTEIAPGVFVRKPAGPPSVATGAIDPHGRPLTAACSTCHTTKTVNTDLKVGMELKTFHQGLKGSHGNLTCVTCHNAGEGYQSLRLADGRGLPYPDVMQLCAQCHGPQYRDYQNGAHGGMTGHWDLSRGGRVRNTCTDCHDPHTPKYPVVRPAPGPRDRFQKPAHTQPGGGHE
jgi:hypothetical protein